MAQPLVRRARVRCDGEMDFAVLVLVGVLVGLTTVLFGFGGGFVTVPIITVVDADLGADTARVAAATSALVMLVGALVATVSTRRETLAHLTGRWWLFGLLALGGGLGALAARFAPEMLLQWGFVVYVAVTAVDIVPCARDSSGGDPRPTPRRARAVAASHRCGVCRSAASPRSSGWEAV